MGKIKQNKPNKVLELNLLSVQINYIAVGFHILYGKKIKT